MGAKMRPRPAPSKTNFFFYDDVMHVILYLNSRADVFRVLLQYAQRIQSKRFDTVQLAYKGKTKFLLDGDYFQNPVYTMRTFP